jgi:hypothetical protein
VITVKVGISSENSMRRKKEEGRRELRIKNNELGSLKGREKEEGRRELRIKNNELGSLNGRRRKKGKGRSE